MLLSWILTSYSVLGIQPPVCCLVIITHNSPSLISGNISIKIQTFASEFNSIAPLFIWDLSWIPWSSDCLCFCYQAGCIPVHHSLLLPILSKRLKCSRHDAPSSLSRPVQVFLLNQWFLFVFVPSFLFSFISTFFFLF